MEIPNLYLWTKAKKEYQKLNSPIWVAVILTDNQCYYFPDLLISECIVMEEYGQEIINLGGVI